MEDSDKRCLYMLNYHKADPIGPLSDYNPIRNITLIDFGVFIHIWLVIKSLRDYENNISLWYHYTDFVVDRFILWMSGLYLTTIE